MSGKTAVIAVAALAVLAGTGYWYWNTPDRVSSVSASLEGRYAIPGIAVPGVVKDVYVKAGERVAQGQPLLALDPSALQNQLSKERVRLAELASHLPPAMLVPSPRGNAPVTPGKPLAALRAEEEEARRAVETAAHEYASANLALSRMDAAAPAGYSQPAPRRQAVLIVRDEAAIALQKAREAHEKTSYARARKEAQDKLDAVNGPVPAILATRLAEYQAQISRVRLAEQGLAETVMLAPESGRVIVQTARPGTRVAPGDAPVAILPEEKGELWVMAFFKKADADSFTQGQECAVTLADGEKPLAGKVERVMAATLSGEEGEKNLAVRVKLDQDALSDSLEPGRTAAVSVITGRPDPLELLRKALRN